MSIPSTLTHFSRPLSQIINTYQKKKFINLNKEYIIDQEIQNRIKTEGNTPQTKEIIDNLENEKQKLRPEYLRKKNKVNVIGVDEGYIKLPKVKSNINWKKLTKEEIEQIENYKLNKDLYKTMNKESIINFLKNNDEDDKAEKFRQRKIEENEIKKLNNWDIQYASNTTKYISRASTFQGLTQSLDSTNMNWMFQIKNNSKEASIISRNKNLKEFFDKFEVEQNAIYNQNMNINKKQFNFNAFDNNNKNVNHSKSSNKSSVDFYKEVMREKIRVEDFLAGHLSNMSQQVYDKKIEKKKIADLVSQILIRLNDIDIEKRNLIEEAKEECDKIRNGEIDIENIDPQYLITKKRKKVIKKKKSILNEQEEKWKKMEKSMKKTVKEKEVIKREIPSHERLIRHQKIVEINQVIINHIKKLDEDKENLRKEMEYKNKKILNIENELRKLKLKVNSRVAEHKRYYFDILKKGIDVRREGLSWILVKLIELKAFIEHSKFPKFLNTKQIEYLLKVAYKQYELSELVKLFTILTNRQKNLKDNLNNNKKLENSLTKTTLDSEISINDKSKNENEYLISNKFMSGFDSIAVKYEKVINIALNTKKEERVIKGIVKNLHKLIIQKNFNDEILDKISFVPGSYAEFFNANTKFREYFDDIFYLNSEIVKREKELKKIKSDEMENFRKENSKRVGNVEIETQFAALFGNGIII